MKTITITITILNFAIFIIGAFTVFSKPDTGSKPRSYTSSIVLFCMIYLLYLAVSTDAIPKHNLVLGLLLSLCSIALFFYTARSVQKGQLSPICSSDKPRLIIFQGPYQLVRHPFYTSYLLGFLAASLHTNSLHAIPAVVITYVVYLRASVEEEFKFFQSELKDDYLSYMRRAGRFFPRFF